MPDLHRKPSSDFLAGGGEMGALMRAYDWASSPLGAPLLWPQSLRTAVRILLNTNHPMFIFWGPDLIQFYNDAYSRTLGDERHPSALGACGRACWAEIWPLIGPEIEQVMAGGPATWHEDRLIPTTRDGRLEQIYWTYGFSPIDLDDGVGGVLVVCRDVTADHVAAEQAREREAELTRVQQIGRIGGLEVDLRTGFRNRRSPEYLLVHGLPPEAANESHDDWVNRIHPDDREATDAAFKNAVKSGVREYSVRYRIIRPSDGEIRWISVKSMIERDVNGRALRLVGAHTDVTDEVNAERALRKSEEEARELAGKLAELNATLEQRVEEKTREREATGVQLKATEEALRQAQKMEAVGQLTGGIAHDFNNLLTGIVGSLDLMRARLAKGRTEGLTRYVDAAMNSANRAAALTHRLLAFARRQPLVPKSIDANALVNSLEDLLRRTIGERLDLVIVVAPDLWGTLCDPNQLESALLNLAINARDAMPDGGKLTIATANAPQETARAEAPVLAPGDYICISVTDTGTGMSPEVVARAFDPFFTTKPIGQGTGLGLSMIYGFARQSNGHVSIDSRPGRGTVVKLYLPRHDGVAATNPAAHPRDVAPVATGETVLVVEDEPVVRTVIMEMLLDQGYRVLEAVDGPSGLRALLAEPRVDLLLTDVGLPGMNGRQLADQARETRPELKILFITGYAESVVMAEGFLLPGMDMITKPFDLDNLARRVREMVTK
ncbi:response regulator [Tardiphaga sp. vice154]|uniref:hybrid sensor histidine kinase/response regulator n=1 Tax=Tardiphaga sp. vice154 TaxID=2592814 RepID=UPI001163AB7D|nr:hybrid sensor histidine kinase/response regulator [Tardiphaga sp. vice154]QDM24218.1 response regulator [Tardiphaga sp. vice154]